MNSRFKKFLKEIEENGDVESALNELHKTFASLTQEEQKYARLFLHDIQAGSIKIDPEKTFRDYITSYQTNAKNDQIHKFAQVLGLNEEKLRKIMQVSIESKDINSFGRFDDLMNTVDINKAKEYLEKVEQKTIPQFRVAMKVNELVRKFIIEGGFEIDT